MNNNSDSLWYGDFSDSVKRIWVPTGQDDNVLRHVALVSLGYLDGQMLEAYVVFKTQSDPVGASMAVGLPVGAWLSIFQPFHFGENKNKKEQKSGLNIIIYPQMQL